LPVENLFITLLITRFPAEEKILPKVFHSPPTLETGGFQHSLTLAKKMIFNGLGKVMNFSTASTTSFFS